MHNKYEETPLVLTKRPHATPTQNSMITQKVKSFDPKQIMIRLVFYLPSTSGRREPTTRLENVENIMSKQGCGLGLVCALALSCSGTSAKGGRTRLTYRVQISTKWPNDLENSLFFLRIILACLGTVGQLQCAGWTLGKQIMNPHLRFKDLLNFYLRMNQSVVMDEQNTTSSPTQDEAQQHNYAMGDLLSDHWASLSALCGISLALGVPLKTFILWHLRHSWTGFCTYVMHKSITFVK